jgi:hypothetical protein
MPNKKQSARPAGSGWLLEIGVLGVDKTLKLVRLLDETLLGAEMLLRNEGAEGVDKRSLPMLVIPEPKWSKRKCPPPVLPEDWGKCLSMASKKRGRELTDDEYYDLVQDWDASRNDYPGRDESDLFSLALEDFELRQVGKGKGPKGEHRPSLSKWMMSAKTFKLFRSGPLDNDTERPKKERIIAHSRALGDALKVISGKLRALPSRYPKAIERHLQGGARETLREIIKHSLELPKIRKKRMTLRSKEQELVALDKKRALLVAEIKEIKGLWEKMGKC